MIEELERIWKHAVVAKSKYYPAFFLERLRKTMKTSISIAVVPAEIRTEHLLNVSLQRYL
jgi:hypothetical protein